GLDGDFLLEIDMRCTPFDESVDARQVLRAVDVVAMLPGGRAEQVNLVADVPERNRCRIPLHILHDAEHPDRRRGEDDPLWVLVVTRNTSSRHRVVERTARIPHSADRLLERPVHLRLIGIAKIQAVRDGDGPAAGAYDIARRLGNGDLGTAAWIEENVASVAVRLHGEAPVGALDTHDGCITGPRTNDRIGTHHRIVLLKYPPFGCDVG